MRIVKIGAFFVVLTGAAAMLASCGTHPTAAKRADSSHVRKDGEPCTTSDGRSGYVVTSGFQTYCQPNP